MARKAIGKSRARVPSEFQVDMWAIGGIPDDGRRVDQVILCKVVQSSGMSAIVQTKDGKLINTATSPRKWFAPQERDQACEWHWENNKTQWVQYYNMLGVIAARQKRLTRDPNHVWEDVDENYVSLAPDAPAKVQEAPQPQPAKPEPVASEDLDQHPKIIALKGKRTEIMAMGYDAAGFEAMLNEMRFEILQGNE